MVRNSIIQFDILNILLDYKRHTIAQIACELGISASSVQRHLTEIALNYPIRILIGGRNSGGVTLMHSAVINNKFINKHELELIIAGLTNISESNMQARKLIQKLKTNKEE